MEIFAATKESLLSWFEYQKQPPRGVPRKRCYENMQQTYRRTPMPNCDFNRVALQLYWNHTSVWVFSCKFAAYFQNIFPYEHLCRATSVFRILSGIYEIFFCENSAHTTPRWVLLYIFFFSESLKISTKLVFFNLYTTSMF